MVRDGSQKQDAADRVFVRTEYGSGSHVSGVRASGGLEGVAVGPQAWSWGLLLPGTLGGRQGLWAGLPRALSHLALGYFMSSWKAWRSVVPTVSCRQRADCVWSSAEYP